MSPVLAAQVATMLMAGGVHCALAETDPLHDPEQSASTLQLGGLNVPSHFGSVKATEQPPLHEPSHCACTLVSSVHEPEQVPLQEALQLPEQVALAAGCVQLPSHLPLQAPAACWVEA